MLLCLNVDLSVMLLYLGVVVSVCCCVGMLICRYVKVLSYVVSNDVVSSDVMT